MVRIIDWFSTRSERKYGRRALVFYGHRIPSRRNCESPLDMIKLPWTLRNNRNWLVYARARDSKDSKGIVGIITVQFLWDSRYQESVLWFVLSAVTIEEESVLDFKDRPELIVTREWIFDEIVTRSDIDMPELERDPDVFDCKLERTSISLRSSGLVLCMKAQCKKTKHEPFYVKFVKIYHHSYRCFLSILLAN